jgi:hypothetical protein
VCVCEGEFVRERASERQSVCMGEEEEKGGGKEEEEEDLFIFNERQPVLLIPILNREGAWEEGGKECVVVCEC